jgi:hypothetical protein
MAGQNPKRIFGMSYLQITILTGLAFVATFLIGCFAVLILFPNRPSFAPPSSPAPDLPPHAINDFWSNDSKTNLAYFIVADKSLTEDEAKTIINHYEAKHKGFILINIWIYCDTTYAYQKYLDDPSVTDDQFFSHVLYWYQTGEISNAGTLFQTKADDAYPTFGSSCNSQERKLIVPT